MIIAMKGNCPRHQQIVGELLDIFQENSYFLCPAKCKFEVSKIECLGLIVDGTTLSVNPKKADGLHNWPRTLSTVNVTIRLQLITQIHWTASFSYLFLPYIEAHVRYDLAVPLCTIRSCGFPLYDMISWLLSMRYYLPTSTCMISISDPRILRYLVLGEFRSLSIAQNLQTPLNTSYAWDISHAFVTTYHLYCHSPSALTEYLKSKLHHQQAKRLGRSPPAQVEQNVQLEHNSKGSTKCIRNPRIPTTLHSSLCQHCTTTHDTHKEK